MPVPINETVRKVIATRRTNLVRDSLGQCQQRSDPELRFLHLNLMGTVKGELFWLSPPGSFSYEKRVRTESFRGSNFDSRDDMVD